MAFVLTQAERRAVERGVGDEVVAVAITRLYKAEGNSREYMYGGIMGVMALARSATGSWSFKLADVNSGRVLWEQDLIKDIKYQQDRPFFHSFLGTTCMIGLSFSDETEAGKFYEKYSHMDSYVPQPQPQSAPVQSTPMAAPLPAQPMTATLPPPPSQPQFSITKSNSSESVNSKKTKKESPGGFSGNSSRFLTGRPKSKKESSKDSKKGKIDKSMISAPSNFEHVSHVGYNPKTGFSAQNIPMEWKIIFQKAGITEEQLQDKRTAKTVAKFMKQHAAELANPKTAQTLAAPGSSSSAAAVPRRAPPPPPPSRGTARAPPPPPPSRGGPPAIHQAPLLPPPSSFSSSPQMNTRQPAIQQPVYTAPPPSLPSRAPPSLPSRGPPPIPAREEYPNPTLPAANSLSTSSPPLAPPPPPVGYSGGAPPPPPPQPALYSSSSQQPPPPARTAIAPPAAAAAGSNGLFDAIRQGIHLKHAAQEPAEVSAPAAPADASDDLAGALRFALEKRIQAVAGSDSDGDDDDDDEW
ncbi:hypothetical protein BASA60_006973 [Batrachochytrium salamandrivorans]|nr:hypothetical protein BASA60_006973 [Batrachochytrium salamandrivorans]